MPDAAAFIGEEKESAVLFDRPAERTPKLILIEHRLHGIEIALRVQRGIAEVVVDIAVQLVGPRLGDDIHHRARVASVLRVKGIGNDAEFLDAVRGRLHGGCVHELIVGVAAVHAEIVGARPAAVYRYRSGIVGAEEQAAAAAQLRLHAGLQLQKLIGVACVQGQLVDRAVVDHRAQLGGGRIDLGSFGVDLNHVLDLAQLQDGIEGHDLVDVDRHAALHTFLETRVLVGCLIDTRHNLHKRVVAIAIALGFSADSGRLIGQRNFDSVQHRAGRVSDPPDDSAAGALSEQGNCEGGQQTKHSQPEG